MFELNPRLLTVAHMADSSLKTVDVGTDHAYLPAYMYLQLGFKNIIACDIGEMPLQNAERNLNFYGIRDKIVLRLSDGLKNIQPDEAQQITICGMGGTLISDILSAAPWIKKDGMRLILQPMTHTEDVRKYLCENAFVITEEKCVTDAGRVYCCICAVYTGTEKTYDEGYYYFGESLSGNGFAGVYVKKQIDRVRKRADALKTAGRFPEEENLLRQVIAYYEREQK